MRRMCQSHTITSVDVLLEWRCADGMINPIQISRQVEDVVAGNVSLEDFERWFRNESRDFLAWGDSRLQRAVFAVEGVLSDYHFDGLEERHVPQELAAAIRPFDAPAVRTPGSWKLIAAHSVAADRVSNNSTVYSWSEQLSSNRVPPQQAWAVSSSGESIVFSDIPFPGAGNANVIPVRQQAIAV
jgi:hypothetical protein